MNRLCVILLPELSGLGAIQRYRERFDPLAEKIPPHITLVFPFQIDAPSVPQVAIHVQNVVKDCSPFDISLGSPSIQADGFVFLFVEEGAEQIRQLHELLYTGPLTRFHQSHIPYVPHLTIGRVANPTKSAGAQEQLKELETPFCGTVREVVVERIAEGERSLVEGRFPFLSRGPLVDPPRAG